MKNNIDFEEEFEQFEKKNKKKSYKDILKNIGVVLIYFLVSELAVFLIVLAFQNTKNFYVETTSKEVIINEIIADENHKTIGIFLGIENTNNALVYSNFSYEETSYVIVFSNQSDIYLLSGAERNTIFADIFSLQNTDYNIAIDENVFFFEDKLLLSNYQIAKSYKSMSLVAGNLVQISLLVIMAIPIVIILNKEIKIDIIAYKKRGKVFLVDWLKYLGIAFVANIAIGFIITLIETLAGTIAPISDNQAIINEMSKGALGFFLMFISACILGPIVEELVFRKAIFGIFNNKILSLVVSALVFGLIHLSSEITSGDFISLILNGISYIGMGFIFGYIYMKNKNNIMISIVVHASMNMIAMLLQLILPLLPY